MKDIAVIIETNINDSIISVWQALTDNRKMNNWYFDIEILNRRLVLNFAFLVVQKKKILAPM